MRRIKYYLKKINIRRTTVLALAFLFMGGVLVRQLFDLQIIQGEDYISKFQSRTTRTRMLKSTRGNIYDGDGNLIASNILSYSLTLEDNGSYSSSREKNLTINGIIYKVRSILEKNGNSLNTSFHVIVDEDGSYAFDVDEGFTLNRFKADVYGYPLIDNMTEEEKNSTAEEMMERLMGEKGFSVVLAGENAYTDEELTDHMLPTHLTKQEIIDIVKIRYGLSNNSFMKYLPITIATNVSVEAVAAILENQAILQGVEVVDDTSRTYEGDDSMGPILGYIGAASAEELEELRAVNPDYSHSAIVGKAGIEQSLELELQGADGYETVIVDNLGKVLNIDEEHTVSPSAGNDVYLTLDTKWQEGIYQILKQRVAGIVLAHINLDKTFDYDKITDSSQIEIPIYSCYNALVENGVIDIRKFADEDASEVEKSLHKKFLQKQEQVFELIRNRLTGNNPPAYKDEDPQMQEYLSYICTDLLTNNLKIINSESVDTTDKTYRAWAKEESISLKAYLNYATSQSWIDLAKIPAEGNYLDSTEVYSALTDYITEYLITDNNFSKKLYKWMLQEDTISGSELELCMYEQGILSKDDPEYASLASGALGPYQFMINKIASLEIEPSMLALEPCSASAVVTDIHTGKVLACVSYPGYDNNRLSNNMDTEYYARVALDKSSPFFNKATQQRTAPGSTMKLLSTIIGMMEGIIDDNTYIECTGKFDYISPPIHCWNRYGHGALEIVTAIQESCNYFFNMIGFQAGKYGDNKFSEAQSLAVLQDWAGQIGLDEKTGIEIGEASPKVSDSLAVPSYMGQGTNMFTTTQLARYVTVLANKGTVYKLSLVDKIVNPEGEIVEDYEPEIVNELSDVPDNVWNDIHAGMRRVVQTHSQFDTLAISLAGKTGTAQIDIYHPDNGLFIGFAPYEEPKYGIAVRIANGYTSGNACLVAKDIVNYIFELKDESQILTGYASGDTSNSSND